MFETKDIQGFSKVFFFLLFKYGPNDTWVVLKFLRLCGIR